MRARSDTTVAALIIGTVLYLSVGTDDREHVASEIEQMASRVDHVVEDFRAGN